MNIIGQIQNFSKVYSAPYRRKPDVMSNIACDWSNSGFTCCANYIVFDEDYMRMGTTILKVFILGRCIFLYWVRNMFYRLARLRKAIFPAIRRFTTPNENFETKRFRSFKSKEIVHKKERRWAILWFRLSKPHQ